MPFASKPYCTTWNAIRAPKLAKLPATFPGELVASRAVVQRLKKLPGPRVGGMLRRVDG
jgi:hypothetical protein